MLSIKNNTMAGNAARHLGLNYDALATSVERLSSGKRINSAKDDAAGMAVSELIRSDVATLQQGSRNAQDAVSMLQTAEGATGVIDDIMVRMKELAEQSSTGSYSDEQRSIMNQEFQQLAGEITRISDSTDFNGIKMLNTNNTYKIDVGSSTTIDVQGAQMTSDALGLTKSKTIDANKNVTADQAANWMVSAVGGEAFTFHFGAEAAVTTNFAAGNYSIAQVADAINSAAHATTPEYNPASVVYNADTGLYALKLTAQTGGTQTLSVTAAPADNKLAAGSFLETAGSAAGEDISTANGATSALSALVTAIQTKDTYRSRLGYMMNRLSTAQQVVDIQAENLNTAQSRISDVDVATEMATMTRTQVLTQAGISMLAQANTMPQMALTLLKG